MDKTSKPVAAATVALSFLLGGCEPADSAASAHAAHASTAVERATCSLRSVGGSEVTGQLDFRQDGEAIAIRGEIRGLTPGLHGFHVHEFGDVRDLEEGKSAGGHFAPGGHDHGRPGDAVRHTGDLGNVEAGADGVAKVDIRDRKIRFAGAESILGRSIVVHAGEDKFTQPSGGAGPRVAIGVIGITKP